MSRPPLDRARLARIGAWVEREIAAGRLPGAALQVWWRGEVVLSLCAGHRDAARTQPVTLDTLFWIASMTKPITSVVVMMLAEEGRVALNAPVAEYLTALADLRVLAGSRLDETVAPERPPTVHDLLRHTAGLTYGFSGTGPLHEAHRDAGILSMRDSLATLIERLARLPLLHQPGTCFEYGVATDVLGAVVEAVEGRPFADVVASRLCAPLGMADTGFVVPPAARARLAAGPALPIVPPPDPVLASGGGGLRSTVPDYLSFARLLLGQGQLEGTRLLAPATLRLMAANHLPPGCRFGPYVASLGSSAPLPELGQGFGLGLAVRVEAGRNPQPGSVGEMYWPGVSGCSFWVDPVQDLAVVFMAHAPEHRVRHRLQLRQLVYQALPE